jgi:hypothetical protein
MKKIFIILILFLLLVSSIIIYKIFPETITGFAVGNTTIRIANKLKGEITSLILDESIELGNIQQIYTEFTNTGSINLTEKIEVIVYIHNETGKLIELAYYYDSQTILKPSLRRGYNVSFLPQQVGLYYVRVKVDYDSSVKERWGAFFAVYNVTTPPIQYVPAPSEGGAPTLIVKEKGEPRMSIEYPKNVKILQGEKKLLNITVKNIGEIYLTNIRFYTTMTKLIEIDINPKQVFKLYPNESVIFLVSFDVPTSTPEGKYPFDFEVINDRTKESGSIEIEVVSIPPSIKEDVYETILNYEYILSEIQNEIDSAALKGMDVRLPLSTINKARISLDTAKRFYEEEKYDDAKKELINTKQYFEEAVLQLASLGIEITLSAAFPWWIILVIVIILMVLPILLIFMKKKKEEKEKKRPKLLRNLSETEA